MNNLNLNTRGRNRYAGKAGLAALVVAASMTVASTQAMAAVTCFTPAAAIPQNIDGIYINLFTAVTGTTGTGTVGWDFNPYASSSATLLSFNLATGAGGVSSGGAFSALPSGTVISAASTFLTGLQTGATAMGTYRAGVTAATYLGLRFTEGASTYYGWMSMTTVGPNGFPATINNYCFENTPGAQISAGTTPVSLQKFSVD